MMIPKPVYELLPGVYIVGAILTLTLNDSAIRFFPALLLLLSAVMVVYLRYDFRHLTPRERAHKMADRVRAHH